MPPSPAPTYTQDQKVKCSLTSEGRRESKLNVSQLGLRIRIQVVPSEMSQYGSSAMNFVVAEQRTDRSRLLLMHWGDMRQAAQQSLEGSAVGCRHGVV